MKKIYASLVVFLVFTGLTGCSAVLRPNMLEPAMHLAESDVPPRAARLLQLVQEKNEQAGSFKGIGQIRLWDGNQIRTSRAAWAGTPEPRLRIEFLGLPGQPVAKFMFNGCRSVFYSCPDQQPFERKSANPNLGPVTGVDVTAGALTLLLAGGIPVYAHDDVSVLTEKGADEGSDRQVLILKKRFFGIVEKIYFNGPAIEKVEIFQRKNTLYQAEPRDIRDVNHQPRPFFLKISNPAGQGFSFHADRQWAGMALRPEMFDPVYDPVPEQ